MTDIEETKIKIKEAALKRFGAFGFGKTTMAEIGRDCDMSAANLYRFYANKKDIAAAIAKDHFAKEHELNRAIVQRTDITAAEKIREFTYQSIELSSEFVKGHKELFETLEFICNEQKDLLKIHIEQKISVMTEILAEGNRTGLFDVQDVVGTADALLKALIFFDYPAFSANCDKATSHEQADKVVDLLLSGLYKR